MFFFPTSFSMFSAPSSAPSPLNETASPSGDGLVGKSPGKNGCCHKLFVFLLEFPLNQSNHINIKMLVFPVEYSLQCNHIDKYQQQKGKEIVITGFRMYSVPEKTINAWILTLDVLPPFLDGCHF